MVLAALRVADDAVLCADIGKLGSGHLAGVCALLVLGNILSAGGDLAVLPRLYHCGQQRCGSAKHDVTCAGLGEVFLQLLHKGLYL